MVQFGMWKNHSFLFLASLLISSLSIILPVTAWAEEATGKARTLLTIQGSNTIGAKLAPALVKGYLQEMGARKIEMFDHAENESQVFAQLNEEPITISIAAHGSSTGFTTLKALQADIAAASRPAKKQEIENLSPLTQLTSAASEHIIGIDGLAIIIHPQNPMQQLSVQQVAAIFSGAIKNWSELGGRVAEINLYARDDQSGTWDSFKRMVLGNSTLAAEAQRFEANDELSDRVSSDVNGIGFVGLPSVRRAKLVAIADGFAKALEPTRLSIATEDYALSRRLYFYTDDEPNNPHVQSFIKFTLSSKGQQIVAANGFISQHINIVEPLGFEDLPLDFQQLTEQGQRLTVNFRFKEGSAKLDNRALRDIERLVQFSQTQPGKKLLLIGFGDQKRSQKRSQLLSKLRAMAVRRELVKQGIYPKFSYGYGEQLPVASNLTEAGRFKNRRVEVWLSDVD